LTPCFSAWGSYVLNTVLAEAIIMLQLVQAWTTNNHKKGFKKMRRTNRKVRNTFTRRSNSKAITLMLLSKGFIKIDPIKLLTYGINRVDVKA
jgi:hypothetical protein